MSLAVKGFDRMNDVKNNLRRAMQDARGACSGSGSDVDIFRKPLMAGTRRLELELRIEAI